MLSSNKTSKNHLAPEWRATKMSFGQAISLFYSNYFNFSTRTSRSGYWWVTLWQIIVMAIGGVLMTVAPALGAIIYFGAAAVHFIPGIAISSRRLHDTSRSGWWILIGFVPLVGPIIILIFMLTGSTPGENDWGVTDA
jgi:uncharacterized membrane protein YhaH (DUF805 family)